MLMQNLRGRVGSRLSGNKEAGFTLIELLVVMLILGILAAIAIPAFFNQKSKATDSKAKSNAHSAQVAIETYSTENNGLYTGATPAILKGIEPTLNGAGAFTVTFPVANGKTYKVTVPSTTGNAFSIERTEAGTFKYECTVAGNGGCPANSKWTE